MTWVVLEIEKGSDKVIENTHLKDLIPLNIIGPMASTWCMHVYGLDMTSLRRKWEGSLWSELYKSWGTSGHPKIIPTFNIPQAATFVQ